MKSMRTQILVSLVLIALVPLIILAVQGYHCAGEAVMELSNAHLTSVLNLRKELVQQWIEERREDVETQARKLALMTPANEDRSNAQASFQAEAEAMLDGHLHGSSEYVSWSVFLPDWTPRFTVARQGTTDLDSSAHAAAVFEHPLSATAIATPPGSEGAHLLIAAPLVGANGTRQGYLVAALAPEARLIPMLADSEGLGTTGQTYLVRQTGSPIDMRGSVSDALREGWSAPTSLTRAGSGVVYYQDAWGERVAGMGTPIDSTDWTLVAEIRESEAHKWLNILLSRIIVTATATLAIVVLAGLWLVRILGGPLRELVGVAHRVAQGDLTVRIPALSTVEANEVRGAFNHMFEEIRDQQRQIVQNATLATVGELTASIVHEIRNPLSTIRINAQALRRAVQEDARMAELGDITLQQVARLDAMLTDLLSFGRPIHLRCVPVPCSALLTAALHAVEARAGERGVSMSVSNMLNSRALSVDSEQMCRAISNLLKNAIEAAREGGHVEIRCRKDEEEDSTTITFEVLDDGPGLSEEALTRAFEPFFTTKREGTGLGLANVRKIVELHRGTISCANRESGGAVFTIRIPLSTSFVEITYG
ncbi:MAG: sensor histidine kinase [Candidatus Hydrogenedentes bacterium]|nr:sensor histidine kinase [Candidatus Hydrogenedentota bacterium]